MSELLWAFSRRKTDVITEAVPEDKDRGKLGCDVPTVGDGGTRYECTKDERGREHDGFHPGKWDERTSGRREERNPCQFKEEIRDRILDKSVITPCVKV